MNTAQLLQPLLDGGIQSIKFFNGRLLSAEDLQQEQQAQREARALLGVALGDGVVHGLEVSRAGAATEPVLRVEAGLAVNREGVPLHVPEGLEISLSPTSQSSVSPVSGDGGAGLFHVCDEPARGDYLSGRDLWIVTIGPAQGTRGRAPVTGLGSSAGACNAKYLIDGVTFRTRCITRRLSASAFGADEEERLRSRLASRCFDHEHALDMARDPFGTPTRQRLVDDLRAENVIPDAEVPLAVFYWKAGVGFVFVDRWSVRRRIALRDRGDRWSPLLSDASRAESEALLVQFQEQIDDLLHMSLAERKVRAEELRASRFFTHLPPVGVLPVVGNPSRGGFSVAEFFHGLTLRPTGGAIPEGPPAFEAHTVIEGSRVRGLLEEALRHAAVSTATDEMFWIYQVRENIQAVRAPGSAVQPYVIFARGAVPYHGGAPFNVAHWGYATYS
ncbi:hypothetical protein [Sorangium sp. So ce128]|uniref:hypothetical protein n=1 Tax=Sorangium sp. So ce128 TaxID=3133281 RepID=UPI003F607221